jgi:hypothetical protein
MARAEGEVKGLGVLGDRGQRLDQMRESSRRSGRLSRATAIRRTLRDTAGIG